MSFDPTAYGALPPEINSGRMYTGVGSGPLLTAAAEWDGLAAELGSAANGYDSVLAELTSLTWIGPTSIAMVCAVTPFVAWLQTTAAQAEQAGMQARAAAAAYEVAFAMTVPPPVIAANRVLLLALIATNFFGQNTAAIAAAEAEYAEFWAQDANAMFNYAESSTAASIFPRFGPPPNTTRPDGLVEQAETVGSAAASASREFPILPTTDWNVLVNTWGLAYFGMGIIQLGTLFAQQLLPETVSASVDAAAGSASSLVRVGAAPVSAGIAQAETIGLMSVPRHWASVPPALTAGAQGISATTTTTTTTTTPQPGSVIPGPTLNGERRTAFGRRRYGRRFRVISRPPAAG